MTAAPREVQGCLALLVVFVMKLASGVELPYTATDILTHGGQELWWSWRLAHLDCLFVVQTLLVFKFIDFYSGGNSILLGSFIICYWVFREWHAHLRLVQGLKLAISEGVHLLTYVCLNKLQFVLLDELSKWIDLFLVEKRHKVVAETTHL